jgi:hypothetical protein
MRRTASQDIRNLETRIANLENKSARATKIMVQEKQLEDSFGTYEETSRESTRMSPRELFSRVSELSHITMETSSHTVTFTGRTPSDKIVELSASAGVLLESMIKDHFLKGVYVQSLTT